ncbi:hypothetical protein T492DRAFT_889003 [Pavlovales sp. CCMP2436]|nr:hypothetical protein T492DRAFT_889003 [Pavlovales sp. CCMP2436]
MAHVSVSETLVIDEVATWVSTVVTESLTSWVRHANAVSSAAGGASPARSRAAGRAAASEALRTAVADLTSSLGSWMDGLAERKAAINVRRSDAIGIERALRMYGTLSVRVRHASNLVGAEPSIEPAVQLLVRGVELVTRGAAGSTRPTWDQQLKFDGQLGRLLERPMLVRVRELVNGEVGRVLGESAVSLTRMLADTSALSASWEALDLCFSGAPDELTGATLSLSATFVPGALHDDVVLRQPGTLRLTVDSGVDLALPYDARELGVLWCSTNTVFT